MGVDRVGSEIGRVFRGWVERVCDEMVSGRAQDQGAQ